MTNSLKQGDRAPAFDLPTNGDGRARLKDYAGQSLILYFYPKDDTSGCTKQAIAFTEYKDKLNAAGIQVLGVSKDSPRSHDKFVEKHKLGIALASDESLEICQAYGVWVEKKMYGRTYMGVERSTFLIGPDGKIKNIWRKVRVAKHMEELLDTLHLTS